MCIQRESGNRKATGRVCRLSGGGCFILARLMFARASRLRNKVEWTGLRDSIRLGHPLQSWHCYPSPVDMAMPSMLSRLGAMLSCIFSTGDGSTWRCGGRLVLGTMTRAKGLDIDCEGDTDSNNHPFQKRPFLRRVEQYHPWVRAMKTP